MKRPTRSELVRSSWQLMVTTGRCSSEPMCSTKRVLPHPVGPVSITGIRWRKACSNSWTSLPLAKYVSVVISSSAGRRSRGDQFAMDMGQYPGQLLDAPDALGPARTEHLRKGIDPRRSDADVVHRHPGIVGLLDRMR